MAHMIIELADYTKKTGGRTHCEYSGDWFLEEILWPQVKQTWMNSHCQIELDFNNVEIKPGFIDQAFSKLISKYRFMESKDCFILKCNDKNIIADIMAAIVGAEFKTFGRVYTQIFKKEV